MTTSVLVPASLAREAEDRREATRKIGYVARAATIFGVDRLTVYPDPDGRGQWETEFVDTVLRYAATPPDVRTDVWEHRDELAYAGVLPPLRVRSRTGSGSNDSGSLRQGIVTEVGSDGRVRVNCGLQHPISLPIPDDRELRKGERVTVRVSSRRPVRAKLAGDPASGDAYAVDRADLRTALDRPDAGLAIAASRYGDPLTLGRLGDCVDRREARGGLTVAFGAPERGLPAILDVDRDAVGRDQLRTDPFDLWLNTVPDQGSDVVRTEEAVFATLSPLRLSEE